MQPGLMPKPTMCCVSASVTISHYISLDQGNPFPRNNGYWEMQLASLSLAEKLKVIFHLCCAHLSSQRLMLPSLLAEEKKEEQERNLLMPVMIPDLLQLAATFLQFNLKHVRLVSVIVVFLLL